MGRCGRVVGVVGKVVVARFRRSTRRRRYMGLGLVGDEAWRSLVEGLGRRGRKHTSFLGGIDLVGSTCMA